MARLKEILLLAALLLLGVTGVYLAVRPDPVQSPEGPSPASKDVAPGRQEHERGAPPPAGASHPEPPIEGMIRDYLRMTLLEASPRDLDQAEHGIERALLEVSPSKRLEFLFRMTAPSARAVVLRSVDDGLLRDRKSEEAAVEAALEKADHDEARAAEVAELAVLRVRDPVRRDRMAGRLAAPGMPEGLLPWAARLATGLPRIRAIQEACWARVPGERAVEALGWVIVPDEATRLESLGGSPAVREALERAYGRTGDPAFRESLRRLGP